MFLSGIDRPIRHCVRDKGSYKGSYAIGEMCDRVKNHNI